MGCQNKLGCWARAVKKWKAAGKPVRSMELVEDLFVIHCQPCRHLNKRWNTCKICGCRVNRRKQPRFNKLRMGTESCPAGKWGAIV